jgi:hypothetical protein
MFCYKSEIIKALNILINNRKQSMCLFSLIAFSDSMHTIIYDKPINMVSELDEMAYFPNGRTALFDTIGSTIKMFENRKNVCVLVITDGIDNKYTLYRRAEVSTIIKNKKSQGWKFIYLASNPLVLKQGRDININEHDNDFNRVVDFSDLPNYFQTVLPSLLK